MILCIGAALESRTRSQTVSYGYCTCPTEVCMCGRPHQALEILWRCNAHCVHCARIGCLWLHTVHYTQRLRLHYVTLQQDRHAI